MATPDELRASVAESREALRAALEAAKAGDWEKRPATGEGEDAWSAREVAQHVIPAEAYFATLMCTACGYPGVEFSNGSYATAADALTALVEVTEVTNKKIKYISDTDLAKTDERWGTVETMMNITIGHLKDHAAQIRTAAGVG